MVWLDVVDNDFWWTNYVEGVKFRRPDGKETSFSVQKAKATTDTGTSCVYMPYQYYESVLEQIQKHAVNPD